MSEKAASAIARMSNERAKEILYCMANGVDPITGEILNQGHFCNHPDIIRALYTAVNALAAPDSQEGEKNTVKNEKLNAGRTWTDEDLNELAFMYRAGVTIEQICKKLQRRERGVLKQLRYLGLIEEDKNTSKAPVPGMERAGLPWTRDEDCKLKELYSEKRTVSEISSELKRSEYSIFCRMEKLELYGEEYGYPNQDDATQWTNKDKLKFRELFRAGKSVGEIAEQLGCTEKSVQARLFYIGLAKESPLPALRKKE